MLEIFFGFQIYLEKEVSIFVVTELIQSKVKMTKIGLKLNAENGGEGMTHSENKNNIVTEQGNNAKGN